MNTEVYKTPEAELLPNNADLNSEANTPASNLAHPGRRFQGQFIDAMLTLAIFAASIALAKKLSLSPNMEVFLFLVPAALYFLFADALPGGQSLAKRLLKISVIDKSTSKPCSLWQSFLRNGVTPILGILDAVLIFSADRQRVGDLLANTIVINKTKK